MEPVMKPTGSLVIVFSVVVLVVAGSSNTAAGDGPNPCQIRPWNSVDNGMGPAPGQVWEFDSGMTVPPGCLSNGRSFLPFVTVALTRTAAGSPTVDLDVRIRGADKFGLPTDISSTPNTVTVDGIPLFPAHQVYEIPTLPSGNMNVNNVLWGDYAYTGASFAEGFTSVFIAADETGPAGETACFAGINGATPNDPCTNGNPNLNAAGIGAESYTYYSRYTNSDQVMSREPLAGIYGSRYLSDPFKNDGLTTHLRVRDGGGGPLVCEYLNIPPDFDFQCPMTQGEIDRLINGDIFVEIEIDGVSEERRVFSAGAFIFVDGFESADTGVWTSSSP
jgi:hypothetical protein